MHKFWITLMSSFWLVPALIVVGAVLLALLMITLDAWLPPEATQRFPYLFGAGAEGARGLLSAIAGSMITVAGVTFSVTIVALSLSAAQYSPRVLRNFMRDRSNQTVLGVFVGIFTYCLLVLRTVEGGETERFVPGLSVLVGIVLALVGVGFLIFFIHHISTAIQASHITANIGADTIRTIDRLFPHRLEAGRARDVGGQSARDAWQTLPAPRTGYIQDVDEDALLALACEHDAVVRMERALGEFVIAGEPLLSLSGTAPPASDITRRARRIYGINDYRNIPQDPAFGIQQLVDIALKGLSPGINDTTTARYSLNHLTAILYHLAPRRIETPYRFDGDDTLRVITLGPSFGQLLDLAFDPIRANALDNVQMVFALLESLDTLGTVVREPSRRQFLRLQVTAVRDAVERMQIVESDREKLRQRGELVAAALAGPEQTSDRTV